MDPFPPAVIEEFDSEIRSYFSFLESEYRLVCRGVRESGVGTRDHGISSSFRNELIWITIAWSDFESSLAISIRINIENIPRHDRYFYFEPLVEFLSEGEVESIIPQYYDRMSEKKIDEVLEKRIWLFKKVGRAELLKKLAIRLHEYMPHILSMSAIDIQEIRSYYNNIK